MTDTNLDQTSHEVVYVSTKTGAIEQAIFQGTEAECVEMCDEQNLDDAAFSLQHYLGVSEPDSRCMVRKFNAAPGVFVGEEFMVKADGVAVMFGSKAGCENFAQTFTGFEFVPVLVIEAR